MHVSGEYEREKALSYLFSDGEQPGRVLREKINADLLTFTETRKIITRCKLGWLLTLSGPAFYQMMDELESIDAVEGWYREFEIEQQKLRERMYKITEGGRRVRNEMLEKSIEPDMRIGFVY